MSGPSIRQDAMRSSKPRGPAKTTETPSTAPVRRRNSEGMARIESGTSWWPGAVRSENSRRWTRPRQKGTRLLALEGQTARQGFSPSLLFAAAFDARPPPSRGYALSRLPTSVEGSSIDGPRSPEGREAQNHGATPSPMGAARPTTIRQQHVSGPQPAVHMKPRRLGVPGSPHWELRSKMPANDPTKGWGLPERPRFR